MDRFENEASINKFLDAFLYKTKEYIEETGLNFAITPRELEIARSLGEKFKSGEIEGINHKVATSLNISEVQVRNYALGIKDKIDPKVIKALGLGSSSEVIGKWYNKALENLFGAEGEVEIDLSEQ